MQKLECVNRISGVAVLLLGCSLVQAQDRRPIPPDTQHASGKIHRMDITVGPSRTVLYFGSGLSADEEASLRDLEQAENDLAYARNLQLLKRQYLQDERRLEAQRENAQQELYGMATTASILGGLGFPGTGLFGLPAYFGSGLPWTFGSFGYPAVPPAIVRSPGFGIPYGITTTPLGGYATANPLLVSPYLAEAVSQEGSLKQSLAQVIAREANSGTVGNAERRYDRALAQASAFPDLREGLGLSEEGSRTSTAPANGSGRKVAPAGVVTLNTGEKIPASKIEETKGWVVITTTGNRVIRVRPEKVERIDE